MSVIQAAVPVAILVSRIKWHCDIDNAFGLLHGMTWSDQPLFTLPQGRDDLPAAFFIDYSDNEQNFAGALRGVAAGRNTNVENSQVISVLLSAWAAAGMYALDENAEAGIMDWVTLFRDACETKLNEDEDGLAVDAGLEESCGKPMLTRVADNILTDPSWSIVLEITLFPDPAVRGTRRDRVTI